MSLASEYITDINFELFIKDINSYIKDNKTSMREFCSKYYRAETYFCNLSRNRKIRKDIFHDVVKILGYDANRYEIEKDVFITVKIPEYEYDFIKKAIKIKNITSSQYVSAIIDDEIKRCRHNFSELEI